MQLIIWSRSCGCVVLLSVHAVGDDDVHRPRPADPTVLCDLCGMSCPTYRERRSYARRCSAILWPLEDKSLPSWNAHLSEPSIAGADRAHGRSRCLRALMHTCTYTHAVGSGGAARLLICLMTAARYASALHYGSMLVPPLFAHNEPVCLFSTLLCSIFLIAVTKTTPVV
jgi:hypothetical protein